MQAASQAEAQAPAEAAATEAPAPSNEVDAHAPQAVDNAVDQPDAAPEAPQGDLDSQELMRQLREAIKERAEQAGRRRKHKGDMQEAGSGPKSTQ
jgi:hypothetical protein